jgi:hypothetical protein
VWFCSFSLFVFVVVILLGLYDCEFVFVMFLSLFV